MDEEKQYKDRKWPRLNDFDYASRQGYFVTICTKKREQILSQIVGRGLAPSVVAETQLTPYGLIAEHDLLEISRHFPCFNLQSYVIMPDHIHILFLLGGGGGAEGASPLPTANREDAANSMAACPTIGTIIGEYKSGVSRKCKRPMWQPYYYDHVLRGADDFIESWQYIEQNPQKWLLAAPSPTNLLTPPTEKL